MIKVLKKTYRSVRTRFCRMRTMMYSIQCRRIVASCGKHLLVNGKCTFSSTTHIGDFCNFNRINILGGSKVFIGNYFHSGIECMIITQNHNYEGRKIPYDDTYIKKNVTISDCVWFGNRVLE